MILAILILGGLLIMVARGSFGRRAFQSLKRKLVEPAVVAPIAQAPITIPGTFDFSATLNSGLILLLEDI